jgi:hypothetical protein
MRTMRIQHLLLFASVLSLAAVGTAWAEQYIFLNDGRVIQAERSEIVGDRIRLETPTGAVVEIPRADVTTIHEPPLPGGAPPPAPQATPPASVYGNMTQQMNEQVRKEIQQGGPGRPR